MGAVRPAKQGELTKQRPSRLPHWMKHEAGDGFRKWGWGKEGERGGWAYG